MGLSINMCCNDGNIMTSYISMVLKERSLVYPGNIILLKASFQPDRTTLIIMTGPPMIII